MKRLDNFNSDHFPIYIALQYEHEATLQQQPMEASAEDKAIAQEKKQAFHHRVCAHTWAQSMV